ncbi:MAG: SurA N-terminal domain-containing protein [Deltaproteobacteria bacterium]|nr:SurA N-terminal domain-containing protein [Deltaproteobacteria bacterium]
MTRNIIIRFMKRHIPLLAATVAWVIQAVWCPANPAIGAELIDRIVAVVNNDLISLEELNNQVKPYLEKINAMGYPPDKQRQMIFKVREDVLNQMIDQKLTEQEIARYKITASDKEVDNAIERVKKANSLTDETLRQALSKEGITYEEYRKRTKEHVLRSILVNREIKSKVVLTKEDIKAYYDAHPDLYGFEEKYHLANVMIKYPESQDPSSRMQTQQKMTVILQELRAGKSIDEVVQAFSDSTAKVQGGELGTFSLLSMDPKIREALKDLQPGQYSGVIETDYGYQIFRLQDKVKTASKTLEDASAEIENKLYKDIVDQKFSKWLEELRSRSLIKITQ